MERKIRLSIILCFVILLSVLLSGCLSTPPGGSTNISINNTYFLINESNNITNNITNNFYTNITNNISNNYYTNITNNITNNISNNYYTNVTNNITNNISNNFNFYTNITNNITQYYNDTNITNLINNVNTTQNIMNLGFYNSTSLLNYLYLPGRTGGQNMSGDYVLKNGILRNDEILSTSLYVATNGSDTTGDGSIGKPFKTIEKAVETYSTYLNSFYIIINIADGEYNDTYINFPSTVRGNIQINGNLFTPQNVILNGNGADRVFSISGDQTITFRGVTIRNAGDYECIYVENANLYLSAIELKNCTGIYVNNNAYLNLFEGAVSTINMNLTAPYATGIYAVDSRVDIATNVNIYESYIGLSAVNTIISLGSTSSKTINIEGKSTTPGYGVQLYGGSSFSVYGNIKYNGKETVNKTSAAVFVGDNSNFFQTNLGTHTFNNSRYGFYVTGTSKVDGLTPTVISQNVNDTYYFDYSTYYLWSNITPTYTKQYNYGYDNRYFVKNSLNNANLYVNGSICIGENCSNPVYPLEINKNVNGISLVAYGNITTTGINYMTSVYDISKGSALDKIQSASELVDVTGKINHSSFYCYGGKILVTDYDKPLITKTTVPDKDRPVMVEVKNNYDYVSDTYTKSEWVITYPYNKTIEVITYPYKKEQSIVSGSCEVDLLKQAVYELKMQNIQKDVTIQNLIQQLNKLNSTSTPQFNGVKLSGSAGVGVAYACFDDKGGIFRSLSPCIK